MNKKTLWLLVFVMWQSEALSSSMGWSTVGGRSTGRGGVVLDAGIGWPGLHAGLAYGVHKQVDLGLRFAFNWGIEGSIRHVDPGMKLQGLVKAQLFNNGFLSFALKFEPGFLAYFHSGGSTLGFTFPLGGQLGIVAAKALTVGIHLDIPMYVTFGSGSSFHIPLLMGGGVEYFFTSKFLANFILKMGPSFHTGGGGAVFVMEAKIGIAYRF